MENVKILKILPWKLIMSKILTKIRFENSRRDQVISKTSPPKLNHFTYYPFTTVITFEHDAGHNLMYINTRDCTIASWEIMVTSLRYSTWLLYYKSVAQAIYVSKCGTLVASLFSLKWTSKWQWACLQDGTFFYAAQAVGSDYAALFQRRVQHAQSACGVAEDSDARRLFSSEHEI